MSEKWSYIEKKEEMKCLISVPELFECEVVEKAA